MSTTTLIILAVIALGAAIGLFAVYRLGDLCDRALYGEDDE